MNIKLSFRLRIALMSVLTTGIILGAVFWLAQNQFMKIEQEELRTEMCIQARRLSLIVRPATPLADFQKGLLSRLKLESDNQLIINWKVFAEQKSWKSQYWPNSLDEEKLSWRLLPVRPKDRLVTVKGEITTIPCYETDFKIRNKGLGGTWIAARAISPDGYGFIAANLKAVTLSAWQGFLDPIIYLVGPIVLVLTFLAGWLISMFAMRPVMMLRSAMKKIDQRGLGRRLEMHGMATEFQDLISAYNEMLKRLEASFQLANRFSADAAHELKTPLTILQGQIEQALASTVDPQQQQLLSGLQEEVAHLSAITRKLLVLSQADAGHLVLDKTMVNWSELLESILTDAVLFVESRKFTINIEPKLQVSGDATLLHQLCNNLIMNAIHHGREASWIIVSAKAIDGGVETLFSNACQPVSTEERARFFDRFYRGDIVRDKGTNGSGLGLSLAREIARAHGGDLTLEPSADDVVLLRLWLPGVSKV